MTDPIASQSRRALISSRFWVIVMSIAILGAVARVAQLQATASSRPARQRVSTSGESTLFARRGALLDREGRVLASTHVGYRLYADPALIKDWSAFSAHVGYALGLDPANVERELGKATDRSRYVVLAPLLDEKQLEAARALELKGLGVEPRPVRSYPQGKLASQLVGFVGVDHEGLDGLEYRLNPTLEAHAGRLEVLRDVKRRPLWIEKTGYTAPDDGPDVQLSIDAVIQQIAEEEVAAACTKHKAKSGVALVMDAATGQILAMVNWPAFDIEQPAGRAAALSRRNRTVTDAYEPGSIFKPFIYAAATSAGVARPEEVIDTTSSGYWVTSFGRPIQDVRGHGRVTWERVLVVSSNIGMTKIGERMGAKRMREAVTNFGFGSTSGVALPGETPGRITSARQWSKYTNTSVPMGYEIAVTPVQMVRAFSAFANHGEMVAPSIVAGETDIPAKQRAIDARTADSVRSLLRRVVEEGTGQSAKSDLYTIWGKTGTAKIADRARGGYIPGAYNASFICGAPLADPKLIVLVTISEPDASIAYYGGTISAPIAKNIVERTLTYLGVAPDMPKDDLPSDREASLSKD